MLLCWSSAPHAQSTKVLFLATIIGSGTESDPFKANGLGTVTGMSCIDLRADPSISTGRMLCASDSLPSGGGINQIGDSFIDNLSGARRTALQSALGITLDSTNIIDVVAEILTTHARIDGTRWKPLIAGRDGQYHIYLGKVSAWQQTAWLWDKWHIHDNGLVADASNFILGLAEPTLAWATSISENWDCADNAALTCQLTWTEVTGTDWTITSNQAKKTTTATGRARADSSLATADFKVTVTIADLTATGTGRGICGPMGRKDNTSTATNYVFAANNQGSSSDHEMSKNISGTLTVIDNNTQDQVDGDVLDLVMNGSSISGYRNGTLLMGPYTDTSITSNTYGGIYSFGSVSTLSCQLDNWSAVDLTSGGMPGRRRLS